jgi:uncharacterized membrane protein
MAGAQAKRWAGLALPLGAFAALAAAAQPAATVAPDPGVPHPLDPDVMDRWLHWTAGGIEAVGVLVIVLGAVAASLHALWRLQNARASTGLYDAYRANLGRAILLGLELLVAADIIGTVAVDPTLQNLGVLALIVAIRTFLSFSLEVEIQGRWPWQHARPTAVEGAE